jgi:hypothetical protein
VGLLNYRDAMSLLQREKDFLLSGMKQKLVWSVSAQMVLFPLMKTGTLDHFGPLVSVMGARQGGKYTFGGSNCSVNGMTVSFDLTKSSERPYVWAKILSLPAWYPRWVGEVPIEIRLNGALLARIEPIGKHETRLGGTLNRNAVLGIREVVEPTKLLSLKPTRNPTRKPF